MTEVLTLVVTLAAIILAWGIGGWCLMKVSERWGAKPEATATMDDLLDGRER